MSNEQNAPAGVQSMRLDKWLWVARFFKSRSLAHEAIQAGHVKLNGYSVKPSKDVHAGDRVSLNTDNEIDELIIEALSERRGPATVARTLYTETTGSLSRKAARESEKSLRIAPPSRPNKRERRQIRDFLDR